MAYTDTTKIVAAMGTALTAEQTSYFTGTLSAGIDAYIDSQTETTFGSTQVVELFVSGSDSDLIIIPTMHDITAIHNMDTNEAVTSDKYTLVPRGGDNKYGIRHKTGSWTDGIENYRITGELGYKDVPADIQMVATELAVNSLSGNTQGYKSERVGDWSVTYADNKFNISPSAQSILAGYRRLSRSI